MKPVLIGIAAATIIGSGVALSLAQGPSVEPRDLSGLVGNPDRGVYVARLGGCVACHTDAKNDGGVLAGGGPIKTDFGTFYGPNITPHTRDGIGTWTLEMFASAMTAGEAPDGSSYYPVFPYDHYTRMTDQDIVDLWAGIRTVPAVAGTAPKHDLSFPFSLRISAGFWRSLFLEPGEIEPNVGEDEIVARGRYLVEGPGHCGACHSPRNYLGGIDYNNEYAGGSGPGGERIPAITQGGLSDGGWTEADIAYALKTGITTSGDVFGGSMVEVVQEGTRFWSEEDRQAVARLLLAIE